MDHSLLDRPVGIPRSLFPALSGNDYAYLNSGGSGPPTRAVIDAMREADDLCSGPAYLEGAAFYARLGEVVARARESAAKLVNAGPGDVALTQNTTHGMNLGVGAVNWQPGDEVISTSTEHPGCLVPLYNLQDRYGVKVNLVSPPITAEKVEAAMTDRTRLVALSHVDWTTGEVLPLQEIAALARSRGVTTLVDGAQSVGNIPVDVPATGVDMYAFTGHKWVLGPEGIGGFYVRPDCELYSPNVGYAALPDSGSFDYEGNYELHEGARRFEASTVSPALAGGFATAAEAVNERGEAGFDGIRERAELLAARLAELPGVTVISPRPAVTGLVSFQLEGVPAPAAAEKLLGERFIVRFIPEPHPYVRASTHLFNTAEELEALVRAVSRL